MPLLLVFLPGLPIFGLRGREVSCAVAVGALAVYGPLAFAISGLGGAGGSLFDR